MRRSNMGNFQSSKSSPAYCYCYGRVCRGRRSDSRMGSQRARGFMIWTVTRAHPTLKRRCRGLGQPLDLGKHQHLRGPGSGRHCLGTAMGFQERSGSGSYSGGMNGRMGECGNGRMDEWMGVSSCDAQVPLLEVISRLFFLTSHGKFIYEDQPTTYLASAASAEPSAASMST